MDFSEDKYISRGKNTSSRIIDETAIVLFLDQDISENVFTLSKTGTRIWQIIGDTGKKVSVIIEELSKELDTEYDAIKTDISKYIMNLAGKKILDISDGE